MASIEKRTRDGRTVWRAHYRTPAGHQRNKTFDRKVDAERFLTSVESSKNTGDYIDPSLARVTIGDWAQTWLDGQNHVKLTTLNRYEGAVRKHILPTWEHVRLWPSPTPTCRCGSPACPKASRQRRCARSTACCR